MELIDVPIAFVLATLILVIGYFVMKYGKRVLRAALRALEATAPERNVEAAGGEAVPYARARRTVGEDLEPGASLRWHRRRRALKLWGVAIGISALLNGFHLLLLVLDLANGVNVYPCAWWISCWLTNVIAYAAGEPWIGSVGFVLSPVLDMVVVYLCGRIPHRTRGITIGFIVLVVLHTLNFFTGQLAFAVVL